MGNFLMSDHRVIFEECTNHMLRSGKYLHVGLQKDISDTIKEYTHWLSRCYQQGTRAGTAAVLH